MRDNHLEKIIHTIIIAGIVEILCLFLSVATGLIIVRQYENIMDLNDGIVSDLNSLTKTLYQHKQLLYSYESNANPEENYEEEIRMQEDIINELLNSIGNSNYLAAHPEHMEAYDELRSKCSEYLLYKEETDSETRLRAINSHVSIMLTWVSEDAWSMNETAIWMERGSIIIHATIIGTTVSLIYYTMKKAKEQGREILRLKDAADEASQAKTSFLANMSHEIRTPINAILGMNEMILRESSEPNIYEYGLDIKTAGTTLLSLINDILDISKVESGKMELNLAEYSIEKLLNEENILLQKKATNKDLGYRLHIAGKLPEKLYGDEWKIKQCITNIINNAIKYTDEGEVAITACYDWMTDKSGLLVISVKDTGIGIKKEDFDNVFETFKRVDAEKTKKIEGTGIGMSLTKQIVELMGGCIELESEYGKGSIFTIKIPQQRTTEKYVETLSSVRTESWEYTLPYTKDACILVTDDNEVNLKTTCLLLKDTNIHITTATSGTQALELLRDGNKYDIIFMDHLMPDMDGIETIERMKEDALIDNTPIVMLTANAIHGMIDTYKKAGFTAYLSKPVDIGQLATLLYELLPDRKVVSNVTYKSRTLQQTKHNGADIIDLEMALASCVSEDVLKEVMADFGQSLIRRLIELEECLEKEDYPNYVIKVHSLKSSARTVGLARLGNSAEAAEKAGKAGEYGKLKELHTALMEDGIEAEQIRKLFVVESTEDALKPEASGAELMMLATDIKKAICDGDMNKADYYANLVAAQRWNDVNEEAAKCILQAASNFDEAEMSRAIDFIEQ